MERNIKHIIKSEGLYFLLLLFSACGQEDILPDSVQGGEATFSLRPIVEPMSGSTATRTGEPAPTINEYTVLVYRKTGSGTPAENQLMMKKQQEGGDELSFTAEQEKGEHYIYVVANAADKLAALVPNGSTEQQLLNIQVDAGRTTEGSVALSNILSSSKITLPNFNVTDFYQATTGKGEIPLKRILAKLTIHFSVSPDIFQPQEVSYISMSTGTTSLIGGKTASTANYLPKITRSNGAWEDPMYMYEQASIRNGEGTQWKNGGFFMVLKGIYKKKETQYFKFALPAIDVTFEDIERNVSYALDIMNIDSYGYASTATAENPNTLFNNIVVFIQPNMTGMEKYKELYTNGYYMMGINSSEFHFYQAFADRKPYLLTEVNYKPLDPSVASDKLTLLPGHSPEITLLTPASGAKYILFTPPSSGMTGDYTATIAYGTLRKPITVSTHPVTTSSDSCVIKGKASNGSVHKFSYSTESAAGTSYHMPVLDSSWSWTSDEWCGLGTNSRFNPTNYFGDISTSLNENIFIHLRPITSTYDGSLRQVYLIAEDHVIDERIGR